jgi:hypothetical protein
MLETDPRLEPVRSRPDFQSLIEQVKKNATNAAEAEASAVR